MVKVHMILRRIRTCLFVLLIVIVLFLSCGNPVQIEPDIPEGPPGSVYNQATGHFYIFHSPSIGWNNAREWAESYNNGYLVTIESETEQEWLVSTFGTDTQYWIGLTDVEEEGVWKWTNGEPVTYTNWAPDGQPDGSGNYAWCGYGEYYWDDHPEYGNNFGAMVEIEP